MSAGRPDEREARRIARLLDDVLNGPGRAPEHKVGFVLWTFDFHVTPTQVDYISNAKRADMISVVRAWLARAEAADPAERPEAH